MKEIIFISLTSPKKMYGTISDYCQKVCESISQESRWEVLQNEIILGFFSFNKFLLWRDLDPKNWPTEFNLLDHPIVQKLLIPPVQADEPGQPIVSNGELIDHFFTPQDLVYVMDADSSQTEAIQTVFKWSKYGYPMAAWHW